MFPLGLTFVKVGLVKGKMTGIDRHDGIAGPSRRDDILILCTANICRSAMAGALLARRLAALPVPASVRSAGMLRSGVAPPPEVISAMGAYGIDVTSHRSSVAAVAELASADLVLGMARANVRHAVVPLPEAGPRAFTLKELARRGQQTGPRPIDEPLAGWLARVHGARERWAQLGDSPEDDIADPFGGPPEAYAGTAALLDQLLARLVELCWPDPAHAGTHPTGRSHPASG